MEITSANLTRAIFALLLGACSEQSAVDTKKDSGLLDHVHHNACSTETAVWMGTEAKQCGFDEWMLEWASRNCENVHEDACFAPFYNKQDQGDWLTRTRPIIRAYFAQRDVGVLDTALKKLANDPNDPIMRVAMCGAGGGSIHLLLVCTEDRTKIEKLGFKSSIEFDIEQHKLGPTPHR